MPFPPKTTEKVLSLSAPLKGGDSQTKLPSSDTDDVLVPTSKFTYFSLFRYATPYDVIGLVLSSIFAMVGGAILPCLTILFGSLTSSFRDSINGEISMATAKRDINKYSLYLVYLAIGEFFTIFMATTGFSLIGEHIALRTRQEYLKAVLRQEIAFFEGTSSGEVATKLSTDINQIQDGISEKVALILSGLAAFVASLIISFIKSWKLTFIVLSSTIALILTFVVGAKLLIGFKSKSIETQSQLSGISEEAVASVRLTTAFGAQEFILNHYNNFLKQGQIVGFKVRCANGILIGCGTAIIYMEHALSFWQGSRFLVNNEISLSAVITIQIAIMMGGASLAQLLPQLQAIPTAIAAGKKVFGTIERRSLIDSLRNEGNTMEMTNGHIEFNCVRFKYPSRKNDVFESLTFTAPAKKITALVGPSGCGKSTVISLLERFYEPISGYIKLDNFNISDLNVRWLRQQISLVNQEPTLFSGTIFENIEFGLKETVTQQDNKKGRMEQVVCAAKIANAHKFISDMPMGYKTQVGDRGSLLSGGQKQRIAIARAIVSNPKILLLDEATAALDSQSEKLVQEAIERASRGRTSIIIAHRLSTIKHADNIIVLSDGHITEQGTYSNLINQDGMFRRLVQAQEINTQGDSFNKIIETQNSFTISTESIPSDPSKAPDTLEKSVPVRESRLSDGPSSSSLLHFMWSLNKAEKGSIFFGVLSSLISGANQPVRGILFGYSIMALSLPLNQSAKIRHDSNFWSGMFLMLAAVQLFALSAQGTFFGWSSERLVRRAQRLALRSILRQDMTFFDKPENSPGKLSTLLSSDANSLAGLSGATLGAIIVFITTVFGSIGIALGYGWKLGLVCMSVMPVLIASGFLRFWVLQKYDKRAERTTKAAGFASESISAIRTVAALTIEDTVMKRYNILLVIDAFSSISFILKSSVAYASSQSIIFAGSALGFWYGGNLIAKGEYSILAFFISFTETLFGAQAAGNIISFLPELGTGKGAAKSFRDLIEYKPEIDVWSTSGESTDNMKGNVEFCNVHFQYPQRPLDPVLKGLSFTAREGQFIALVGASGSGKSTCMELMERFYNPSSGSILLDGKPISDFNLRQYREQMALVRQDTALYTGNIKENLCLDHSGTVDDETLENVCKAANIYDFIMSLPDGFNTLVGTKGSSLSGGQRQRLAIARALLRNPKILLLDEATSALDTTSEKIVEEALKTAIEGRTTIAIAHRLSSIFHADMIYVLDSGCVIESGTHIELMELKGKYWTMANLQSLSM